MNSSLSLRWATPTFPVCALSAASIPMCRYPSFTVGSTDDIHVVPWQQFVERSVTMDFAASIPLDAPVNPV